eukprot:Hpha_TRINITY_DN15585_c1_g8::TRINITY_DN15585_c1_g8_i4::g.103903::m.103903
MSSPGSSPPRRPPSPDTSTLKYPKMQEGTPGAGAPTGGQWLVTEKIHGANLCIVVQQGKPVSFAKRTGPLGEREDFFGLRSSGLAGVLEDKARALHTTAGVTVVQVFGELYGGRYEHPDVPRGGVARPVQHGVWYSPDVRYVAFDVFADGRFINFEEARRLCRGVDIPFAEPLFSGSLQKCLDFPVRFVTHVPRTLGLPVLADNWAEGVVVRPKIEPSKGRGLFKLKIPEFGEREYDGVKMEGKPTRGKGEWELEGEALRWELLAGLTPARVAAAESKTGAASLSDKESLRALLNLIVLPVVSSCRFSRTGKGPLAPNRLLLLLLTD